MPQTRKHYIAMSGEHGCLPDCVMFAFVKENAISGMAEVFSDVRGVKSNLRKYGSMELPSYAGAEYCEIAECTCSTPWVHSDDMTEEQFKREYAAYLPTEETDQ